MLWKLLAVALLAIGLSVGVACGDDDDDDDDTTGDDTATEKTAPTDGGGGEAIEVVATDFQFDPAAVEAQPGDKLTVEFSNEGAVAHSFTIDALDVDVEAEGGDAADPVTFTVPEGGTDFYCRYHPRQMTGTIGS